MSANGKVLKKSSSVAGLHGLPRDAILPLLTIARGIASTSWSKTK
jgi:hypothetical protein